MLPKLTRRRVFATCLLVLGTLLLGAGAWQQNVPLAILGLAFWVMAIAGLGMLALWRINAVMQVAAATRSDLQQLGTAVNKSTWLLRRTLEQTGRVSSDLKALRATHGKELKRQAEELSQVGTNLAAMSDRLVSGQSTTAAWREDHSEQITLFRRQFGEFVASVAEWIALAEVQARQSVAELAAGEASAIDAGVRALARRFDQVDGILANLREVTLDLPAAIAGTDGQIASMADFIQVAIDELRVPQQRALLEELERRIEGVDRRLSSLQQAAAADIRPELIADLSQTIRSILHETRSTGHEEILEAVQRRLNAVNDSVEAMQEASTRMREMTAADSEEIKSISRSINAILPSQRTEIVRAKIELGKEVEAILQLQSFLSPRTPMPLLGGWAMDPVAMLGVVNELVATEPELCLECGCGTSTVWIASVLKRIGKGRLVALEHLEEHHAATSRALHAAGLADFVDLRLAPLRTHRIGKDHFRWYDLKRIDLPMNSVDFLLIDGPPQSTGPLARYPALPLLQRVLADQALIVLDDANRPGEIEEAARWLEEFPGFQEMSDLGARTKMFVYSSTGSAERTGTAHLQAL